MWEWIAGRAEAEYTFLNKTHYHDTTVVPTALLCQTKRDMSSLMMNISDCCCYLTFTLTFKKERTIFSGSLKVLHVGV